jgi:butyryl-CoA dehydrogenase
MCTALAPWRMMQGIHASPLAVCPFEGEPTMDFNPSEPEAMARQQARSFADEHVAPLAGAIDITGVIPTETLSAMREMGLFGIPYGADVGGSGGSYLMLGMVVEELARASLAVAATVSVHHLATEAIHRFGDPDQRDRHLKPLASGAEIGCFAFTEAETGSDPRRIETTATPFDGGWRLSGEKAFVSLAPLASRGVVFAKDESGRVSAFVVDMTDSRVDVGTPYETLGARGLATAPVTFDDVLVPSADRLGESGGGYEVLLEAISVGKLCVALQAVGLGQSALGHSVAYARSRVVYGAPQSHLPTIQVKLAEMASRVEAARWMSYRSISLRDTDEPIREAAALAKLFSARVAVEVAGLAMEIHGVYGYVRGAAVERIYREAKLTELYEGVPDIQRVIVAAGLLGS